MPHSVAGEANQDDGLQRFIGKKLFDLQQCSSSVGFTYPFVLFLSYENYRLLRLFSSIITWNHWRKKRKITADEQKPNRESKTWSPRQNIAVHPLFGVRCASHLSLGSNCLCCSCLAPLLSLADSSPAKIRVTK